MPRIGSHAYGATLVAIAAVLWSTAGIYVRLVPVDTWTMLGWRSFFAGLALGALVIGRERRNTLRAFGGIGRPGLWAIPLGVVSMASYVIALKLTSVANVMVIYATVPFVAAAIAWMWIGERTSTRVLAACAIALVGIAISVGGAGSLQDLAGIGASFVMTVAFAVQLVMARKYPKLDMGVIKTASGLICAALCVPFASTVVPGPVDLTLLALFGVTTTGLAYLLFLTGGRYIPSAEAGLIGLGDMVLGPLWVWMLFAERPNDATLVGGALVLVAMGYYFVGQVRPAEPRPA